MYIPRIDYDILYVYPFVVGYCVSAWQVAVSISSSIRMLVDSFARGGHNYDLFSESGTRGTLEWLPNRTREVAEFVRLHGTNVFKQIHYARDTSIKLFAELMNQLPQNMRGHNYDQSSPLPPESLLAMLFPALYRRLHPPDPRIQVPEVVIFGISVPLLLLDLIVTSILLLLCAILFVIVSTSRMRRLERMRAMR